MKKFASVVLSIVILMLSSLTVWAENTGSNQWNLHQASYENETEIQEGGSFKGVLMDAYGQSVPNKTITFHKPGYQMGTLVDTQTDENGEFFIENVEYLADAGKDNYYGDFTFAGDDKYQGCTYIGNITVIPN